jgi:hypothetical protein
MKVIIYSNYVTERTVNSNGSGHNFYYEAGDSVMLYLKKSYINFKCCVRFYIEK